MVWGVGLAFRAVKLPLLLGELLAGLLFGTSLIQALFIGMGMSITAISVTVKIFKDFDFADKKIINLVMAAALADDILAFVLVSVVLTVATVGTLTPLNTLLVVLKVAAFFIAILFIGVRLLKPVFDRFFTKIGGTAFPLTIILGLFFGLIAEKLGIHYVIGAYMAGLFMKGEHINGAVFDRIEDRLNAIAYGFLGPIFFVSLGFAVDFSSFANPRSLLFLSAILVTSIIGKVVGSGGIARITGSSWRESTIIGLAMNGRGAVELILATIGLEAGIITPEIFSILVFMALFTTFVTPIGFKLVLKGKNHVNSA